MSAPEGAVGMLRVVERVVVLALLAMMSLVVVLATVDVGWVIVTAIVSPPIGIVSVTELLDMFGAFLLVLIGVELMETVRAYLTEHEVHVEVVLEVALIAIARKVIVLDLDAHDRLTVLAIAALVATLAAAYYLVRRAGRHPAAR